MHTYKRDKTMAEKQLLRAKQLIQAKRYEDARALLITVDHPTADKWLDRLSKVPTAASVGPLPDYTNKAVALLVLYFVLFIPGLIAGQIWAQQARNDLNRYGDIPGAKALISIT